MKFRTNVLVVPFEGHYTVFSISWPCWGVLVGIFGLILKNVSQILLNCLISSQETLYRCSWYNPDITNTKIFFWDHVPPIRGSFWGSILAFNVYFLRTVQYVFIKFCIGVLGVHLRVTALFLSISWPCWGALGGIFGLIFSVLRKSQYFLMMFCTKLLGNTLIVSKQKIMLRQSGLRTFWGVLGGFKISCSREPYNIFIQNVLD